MCLELTVAYPAFCQGTKSVHPLLLSLLPPFSLFSPDFQLSFSGVEVRVAVVGSPTLGIAPGIILQFNMPFFVHFGCESVSPPSTLVNNFCQR